MKKMDINNKKFVAVSNESGLSSSLTVFHYFQKDGKITGTYSGGAIVNGSIVGKQLNNDTISLLFQCLTDEGHLMAGQSTGKVSLNKDGRLELSFDWEWLNGDKSGGKSHYIETTDEV